MIAEGGIIKMKYSFTRPKMLHDATQGKKGHALGIEILIFVLVFLVAQTLVSIPVTIASIAWMLFPDPETKALMEQALRGKDMTTYSALAEQLAANQPDWLLLVQLFSTALATAVAILYCRLIERRSLVSMGIRRYGAIREYLLGVPIGIALISATVGICASFGAVKLTPQSFSLAPWILFLLGFLVQGMSEEVLCRGYMMVSVSRRHSLLLAVITNSMLFSLLHIFNPGFGLLPLINIILFGILESIYVLRRGDLWGACAIHSIWNFFQGNVFGISVSGLGITTSPLRATLDPSAAWLNGGSFGLEGGIATTAVLTIACLILIFLVPSKEDADEIIQNNNDLSPTAEEQKGI